MATFKLKSINQFNKMEMAGVLLIAIFILFPIRVPSWVNSPISYIVLLAAAVFLFMYANPILGVLFLFVIYEIMRRASSFDFEPSNNANTNYSEPMTPAIADTAASSGDDSTILGGEQPKTLEEEFVNTLAPIGHSETPKDNDDSVRPVSSNLSGASLF